MTQSELENAKLLAEIRKLDAETESLGRGWWSRAGEVVKIIGAILAAVAAGYAAITTYRITQLETKIASYEKQQAEMERARAVAARNVAIEETRKAIAAQVAASRDAAAAANQVKFARDAQLRATRERDMALQKLKSASAARATADRQRRAAEMRLANVRMQVELAKLELTTLEHEKNLTEVEEAVKRLRALLVDVTTQTVP